MLSLDDYEKFKAERSNSAEYDVQSLLSVGKAMQFQQEQTTSDKALEVGENVLKSLYNGSVVQYGGGAVNFLRGLHDVNVEKLNRDYPERMQGDSTLLEDIANSSVFQPYEVKADTAAGEYAYNLVQGAGQLAVQIPASMALGPVGSTALMGMTIAGQDYKELREQGVDPETSLKAGAIDAAIQAPLESIGLGAITKSFPANTLLKQQVRSVILRGLEEGVTEWAEQYPDEITKIWALNKDKSMDEILQLVIDALPSITKHGIYAGSIGWVLGGGVSGVNLAIDRVTGRHIEHAMERAAQREAYTARMEQEESRINRIKESGENPARAAVIINDNLQNETVYVDGETLQGYAQEKGIEKVAESLGVTVEDIEKAAAEGDTVDVKIGNFEATGAAFDGFMDAVKDDTAFEEGGYTPNQDKLEQEWAKKYQAQEQAINTEEDRLFNEMREAGVNKQTATEGLALLRARAVMMDDPAEFLKKLSFQAGGDAGNGYQQFAGENAETADKVKLADAQKMESEGKSADEIYKATGWFKGKDNKWRFEIKDDLDSIDLGSLWASKSVPLGRIYYNPDLYDAYPWLRLVSVQATTDINENYYGETTYDEDGNVVILLNQDMFSEGERETKLTLVHEIAHVIQDVENFATGGTAKYAREALAETGRSKEIENVSDNEIYKRLGGEEEAREVERRAEIEKDLADKSKEADSAKAQNDKKKYFMARLSKEGLLRKSEAMPRPHSDNAIIIFDGQEISYSPKQNEALTPQQSLEAFLQVNSGEAETKGEYNPNTNIITLFNGADASTVIHETWHFFVEQMWNSVQDGTASAQTIKDFDTLLGYAGMTRDEWANADVNGRRAAHERLAEAGETYIMEGKSPSFELRRVFQKFAEWLKSVYRTLQRSENAAELTDEVREVFDRMLAAEDDIAYMERVNGYFAKLPDVITDNMSEATKMRVENFIDKARDKAVEMLTRRALKNYTKERREEVKKFKEEIRPSVEDEVSKRRVYACGYDKNDADRFQKLQKQKAEFGIYTDENFIDRSFPAETDEAQNEVAHLAAVVNPKNWTKGLAEVKKDFQRQADEMLQPAIDALEKGMGQGVDILRETNEYGEAKGDIVGRVSNNAPWYQKFYAEYKRKPTKAELREMARDLIAGNGYAPEVDDWAWGIHSDEDAEYRKAEGERLSSIERRIEACDEIKEKLKTVEEGYKSTSAAGSEDFMFQAQITAEQYGYSSADEMMKDIEASPTKEQAVKQRINERVEELSGENEKENYASAIREALYNEDEALLIGVEQQLIEDYAAKAKERQEAQDQKTAERKEQAKISAEIAAARKQQAKNAARADLAKMTVKEATRTNKFITAERRAAAKCAELLAKKKFDEALTQKNLQAYWHAMAAESIKIAKRQKQYEKFLKTQVKLKPEAWLNETNFAAVSQLFSRMGIARPVHMEAAGNTEYPSLAAYADAMEQLYDCVDIAPWILDESIPLSDTNALTLEQYEDVVNAVKNIKAIVKAQKGVDTFNRQETWANTKALIMEKLSALKTIWTPNPNKPTKASQMERFIASMENLDTFLEFMDNATYGFFSKTFGNAIKHASDKEYEYREQYDKADAEALKKWLPDAAAESASNEEVYYDELGNSVTKHTLVKMLINLGNKENAQRLCETVPVGFERSTLWIMPDEITDRQTAAETTKQNLIDFLGRVLTKEDVEYAQRKIDAAEMFWGEKNELEKRVKGFGLKKVEATPVELMINGEPVVLRGGYFPLMRNGETGSHAATAEVQDDDPLQGKRIRTYHTNTSATKARTQARYPVNLFPGAETQWIYESIHDLCWRETMNDFRRVLNDQELFATMKSKIGAARMQVFKEMLEVCADPRGNSKSVSEFEKLLGDQINWLRQRVSHAAIMLNLKVIAQNYANALLYGNAIEGYTMADNLKAIGTYMLKYHLPGSHGEMVDFVFSKSSFLRERCELPDITVRDIVNEKKEFAWEKAAREIGIKAMAMTDNATAIPNWLTAYNKKLSEGALEQEAIDYADTLVRRVLGSSRITDVASMQRGGALAKALTMFQSFFNARLGEFLRMERLASKQWTNGQKMEAFANVASYVVYKWLGQTMLAMALALQNPLGVDDDDKWPELVKELKSYSFSMMGPAGQLGNALAGSVAGMHEYTYRMSAIESTIENVNRSIKRIHSDKATTQDKLEGITNTITLFAGVPAQLNRIFWNTVDIVLNGMKPEVGDIMRRRPKKERK